MSQLIGFPFFEAQAKWIAQVLSGKSSLPSPDQMLQSVADFYRSRDLAGVPKHNTHDIANFEVIKPSIQKNRNYIYFCNSYPKIYLCCLLNSIATSTRIMLDFRIWKNGESYSACQLSLTRRKI